jgi:hypothetical protein
MAAVLIGPTTKTTTSQKNVGLERIKSFLRVMKMHWRNGGNTSAILNLRNTRRLMVRYKKRASWLQRRSKPFGEEERVVTLPVIDTE